MLLFGFLLVSFAVSLLLYDKSVRIKRCSEEYGALLSLLVYFKGGIASERRTPLELFRSFSEKEEGRGLPWLASLFEEEESSCDTHCESADFGEIGERVTVFMRERRILTAESYLSREDKERVASLFFDFGKHTAQQELQCLGDSIAHFSKREAEVREASEKSLKAMWLLFVTAAAGLFIIML